MKNLKIFPIKRTKTILGENNQVKKVKEYLYCHCNPAITKNHRMIRNEYL